MCCRSCTVVLFVLVVPVCVCVIRDTSKLSERPSLRGSKISGDSSVSAFSRDGAAGTWGQVGRVRALIAFHSIVIVYAIMPVSAALLANL